MTELLNKISQISIYLKEEQERINEISLFEPLARKTEFEEKSKPIQQRKWSYTYQLPLLRRLSLRVQSFLFKRARYFIPGERLTSEAKFKTVLALLLAQEPLREFFLSNKKRRDNFFQAIQNAAHDSGYKNFSVPRGTSPLQISQNLTWISGKPASLIDDLYELNLQMAALRYEERNEILFQILNRVQRPPITSVLEVMHEQQIEKIALTTHYARYKITEIDQVTGKISYQSIKDHATSSIRTIQNSRPGKKGVMNQRFVLDREEEKWIGSYSGELNSEPHILEQLLFMLQLDQQEVYLLEKGEPTEEMTIQFTSLFSWHEMGLILDQHKAIRNLNRRILKIGPDRLIRLNLIHSNVSFNALNKYPTPAELGATIRDINDEALICLMSEVWSNLDLYSDKLDELQKGLHSIAFEENFLKYQAERLKMIDLFRENKKTLINQLEKQHQGTLCQASLALLKGKRPDGKILKGMDLLLYLGILTDQLGILHNKNCQHSTDRSAGANAADKAQYAYQKIYKKNFLPGYADEKELSLFKVLYSMYLVWEEPEINAALSTGFVGEKFHQNFLQKNYETTQYLIWWLKKHPEIYLGLSDQRS